MRFALGTAVALLAHFSTITVERVDPIRSFGRVSGHVHAAVGGSGFGPSSTYEDLRNSRCSTCDTPADNSAYWVPQLYFHWANGSFTPVEQTTTHISYFRRLNAYDKTPVTAFPEGFQMIAGDPNLRAYDRNDNETLAISWHCYEDGVNLAAKPDTDDDSYNIPEKNCGVGLIQQVRFPTCWDGVRLNSTDQSHMSYSSGGNGDQGQDGSPCPSSHPVRLVEIFLAAHWDVGAWNGQRKFAKNPNQPFVSAQGDPTGYGSHGDFQNGWNVPILQNAIDVCLKQNAPIGPAACPQLQSTVHLPQTICQKAPDVREAVLSTLDHLPGCNPVTYDQRQIPLTCGLELPPIVVPPRVTVGDPVQPYQYPASSYGGPAAQLAPAAPVAPVAPAAKANGPSTVYVFAPQQTPASAPRVAQAPPPQVPAYQAPAPVVAPPGGGYFTTIVSYIQPSQQTPVAQAPQPARVAPNAPNGFQPGDSGLRTIYIFAKKGKATQEAAEAASTSTPSSS